MSFEGSDVLPGNATELERAMADMDWVRLSDIEFEVVRSMTNPQTCPAIFLPWLAWSVSVDVWDEAWSEDTKRAVIAAAPASHRVKGTRRAVRLVLEALGLSPTLTEWWEDVPARRRGSFRVSLPVTGEGPVLDAALIDHVRSAVRRAKPKSRVFTVDLVSAQDVALNTGAAIMGRMTLMLPPYPGDET